MTPTKYENVFVEDAHLYRVINGKYHKLHEFVDNVGYYQTVFRLGGKRKYVRIHRVVAETLIPNPNGFNQVNHKNGNKLDNRPENLEWCNNSYNTKHGYDNNLYHSPRRSHQVLAIDKNTNIRMTFKSVRECGEILGLNRKTITSILKGLKHNNFHYEFKYVDECID